MRVFALPGILGGAAKPQGASNCATLPGKPAKGSQGVRGSGRQVTGNAFRRGHLRKTLVLRNFLYLWGMRVKSQKLAIRRNLSGAKSDATLVNLWLAGKSKGTQKTYAGILHRFFTQVPKPLSEITILDLQFYANYLSGLGLHPNTLKLHQMAIKSLLAFGAKTGYLRYDVGRAWQAEKGVSDVSGRILSEAEVIRLLHAPKKRLRDQVLLELLYATGMRVSEVASLAWENVREDTRGGVLSVKGKGGKIRYVRIPKELLERLREQNPRQSGAVFLSQMGKPLSVRQIENLVKDLSLRELGKAVSPHWFRHCHATHCLRRGVRVVDVAAVLGHANISITSRYLHADPEFCAGDVLPIR